MKKTILTVLISIVCFTAGAQVFASMGYNNHGPEFQLGVIDPGGVVEFKIAAKLSILPTNPWITSATIGHVLTLTNYEDETKNFHLIPSIGFAHYHYRTKPDDLNKQDPNEEKGWGFISGLEVNKDFAAGRLYVSANYAKSLYVGLGMKVFFSKL